MFTIGWGLNPHPIVPSALCPQHSCLLQEVLISDSYKRLHRMLNYCTDFATIASSYLTNKKTIYVLKHDDGIVRMYLKQYNLG
ncbi:MAG: hypothetical protein PUP92_15615 [Rhizonema sp. PD38]|nr:hypothetical protein [Rhizonema sp. PD38]